MSTILYSSEMITLNCSLSTSSNPERSARNFKSFNSLVFNSSNITLRNTMPLDKKISD